MIDTIAAVATPPGKGGVGIIRLSGSKALSIGKKISQIDQKSILPRHAYFTKFYDFKTNLLDEGLFLYFPGPDSFTGEDVVELQAHGGPVVLDLLLRATLSYGARVARPGEFSERAFLNNKIDLLQAEAIADLIESSSEQAARCAIRSLSGGFSEEINLLLKGLTELRMYVEATLDFPEEEIDFLADKKVENRLKVIFDCCKATLNKAHQGCVLKEGLKIAILGEPNVGKSSLLNLLADQERAIVTDIPGTTRDVLHQELLIDGIPIHLVDTAGLRETQDVVELEGIKRAHQEVQNADHVLLLVDVNSIPIENFLEFKTEWENNWPDTFAKWDWHRDKLTLVFNKIDINQSNPGSYLLDDGLVALSLSVKTRAGFEDLKMRIKSLAGMGESECEYIARRRHLNALERTCECIDTALNNLIKDLTPELVAEELKLAQQSLGEITGDFSPDDLLGEIFSSFCIGK